MNPFINHCALQTATVVSSDTWSKNGNRVVKKFQKSFFLSSQIKTQSISLKSMRKMVIEITKNL